MGVSQEYMTFPDSFQFFANTGIGMLLVGLKSIFYSQCHWWAWVFGRNVKPSVAQHGNWKIPSLEEHLKVTDR